MDANTRDNLLGCQVTRGQDARLSRQCESLGNEPGPPPGWHLSAADYLQTQALKTASRAFIGAGWPTAGQFQRRGSSCYQINRVTS